MAAFKTQRAHPEIIRREGLGAQQCTACGAVYRDTNIPERCTNSACPTNVPTANPVIINHQCGWCGEITPHSCTAVGTEVAPHLAVYYLTKEDGESVQRLLLILRRHMPYESQELERLIQLFN